MIASESWPVLAAIASLLAKFHAMTLCFPELIRSLDLVLQQCHQLQFDINQALEQTRLPIGRAALSEGIAKLHKDWVVAIQDDNVCIAMGLYFKLSS